MLLSYKNSRLTNDKKIVLIKIVDSFVKRLIKIGIKSCVGGVNGNNKGNRKGV